MGTSINSIDDDSFFAHDTFLSTTGPYAPFPSIRDAFLFDTPLETYVYVQAALSFICFKLSSRRPQRHPILQLLLLICLIHQPCSSNWSPRWQGRTCHTRRSSISTPDSPTTTPSQFRRRIKSARCSLPSTSPRRRRWWSNDAWWGGCSHGRGGVTARGAQKIRFAGFQWWDRFPEGLFKVNTACFC